MAFATLTWLLPGGAIVDVPLATEAEVVVGAGCDLAADRPALHVDLWGGRMWIPSRRSLIVADAWSSGYLGGGTVKAATARVSVLGVRGARRGSWSVRLSGERLLAPDPDVRAFSSFDPTLPALPERARLADASGAVQIERTVHVRRLSRSWSVEAAALAAGSVRWEPVLPDAEQVSVGVLGLGLRLSPNRPGRGSARLDVGVPVIGSGAVVRRPYVALSVLPWFEQGRQRDGRRDR
jgi:hypothetical protein